MIKSGIMSNTLSLGAIISWFFGILVLAIGILNVFWGNDPGFGIFLVLLSLIYFPPVNVLVREITGFSIPALAKIIVGLFVIWASLGVGELFDKISLMLQDF